MPSPSYRPDAYTSQVNSPLFCLPRELRDEIYQYYAYEENGYFHNIDTGKLSLADREPIDLRLTYTCRAIAEEMKGVALRANTIIFKTGDIEDSGGYRGLRSRAGRFKQTLDIVVSHRLAIFVCVLPLITPELLEQVIAKFGSDGQYISEAVTNFRFRKKIPKRLRPRTGSYSRNNFDSAHEVTMSLHIALCYTLQLASSKPEFENIASQAFYLIEGFRARRAESMIAAAYKTVMGWQPNPWHIPSDAELSSVEKAMYTPDDPSDEIITEHFDFACQYRWFFSAAAIAINFFEHHPRQRGLIRQVILREDHVSVSNSESHLLGFARLSNDMPQLRIERQIELWSSIYYHQWIHLKHLPVQPMLLNGVNFANIDPELENPTVGDLLPAVVEWLREVMRLQREVPGLNFRLTLNKYPVVVWDYMRDVAMLQETMSEQCRRVKAFPPRARQVGGPGSAYYVCPCDVPQEFTQGIKEILSCFESHLSFDSVHAVPWDIEETVVERLQWTVETLQSAWKTLLHKTIKLPEGGRRTLVKRYWVESPRPFTLV